MDDVEGPAFQRARRPEHRELRRQEILDAAEALLAEMPAEEISLRELGRRLGVSKTHVVRYFESREGVFLGLLNRVLLSWLEALPDEWPALPCEPDRVMRAWADSLAARPVLCQLWSLLPSVLERNVSADTVRAYKLLDLERRTRLAKLIRDRVPALSADDALTLTRYAVVSLVGLWPFSNPTPTVVEATADPRLTGSRVDFAAMYGEILQTTLAGLLARA
ncbi:TetR family transcriptional regulator [Planotetraspora phitsanulokensis]|uniref:TetR family transcriptional regulator n=1 Tax=Planotetraspora phitsanulokensis TaxID=575192 RepID=A0A8J3U1J7_9ACTN|nr:TetR/AcrR family transcriptional regulator [Planotetraspora phitsanulokensis]GII36624.1 TetR family transcriptional regulator [Planotetraspora phitsanulokensis]